MGFQLYQWKLRPNPPGVAIRPRRIDASAGPKKTTGTADRRNMRSRTNRSFEKALCFISVLVVTAGAFPFGAVAARIMNPEYATEESVYVNVERGGHVVSGLDESNFRVYQGGLSRPFRLAEPESQVNIGVLVENSKSSARYTGDIAAALAGLRKNASTGHLYALTTFSGEVGMQSDFSRDISRIALSTREMGDSVWSEINTYDAVYEMVDRMKHLPGRRVLILIGSGVDTCSDHKLDDVKKKLEAENVTIYSTALGTAFRNGASPYSSKLPRMDFGQGEGVLRMLAHKSGGYAWFPSRADAFGDAIKGIMRNIASQYRLVYVTDAHGSFQYSPIKVEAFRSVGDRHEEYKVLVRDGWR